MFTLFQGLPSNNTIENGWERPLGFEIEEVSRCRESCAWKQVVGQESRCGAVALGEEGFAEVPSMDMQEGSVRKECA